MHDPFPLPSSTHRGLRSRRLLLLAALFLLHAGFLLALYLARTPLVRFDHRLDDAMRSRVDRPIRRIALVVLQLGAPYVIAALGVAVGLGLLRRRRWPELAAWAIALGGCGLIDYALKEHFRRPRPPSLRSMAGWTFPSGHTMAAIVAYGMLACFLLPHARRPAVRCLLIAAPALLGAATGAALLVPGYHYLTDVLAGYAIGGMWLIVCIAGLTLITATQPVTGRPYS